MFLFVWAMVIVFRLASLMLGSVARTISSSAGIHSFQFVIAATVIILGFLAFEFKKKHQLWYGRVEICFGISSAVTLSLSALPSDMHLTQWASLVGCVYVIARGMGNVSDASGDPRFSGIAHVVAERV
jgi:hypothetical protein